MEKDLQEGYVLRVATSKSDDRTENNIENNLGIVQKRAALAPSVWYNGIKSQNDLGCELQAKEGVLV